MHQAQCSEPLFCFPTRGPKTQVCVSPWPADSANFLHVLSGSLPKPTCATVGSTHKELATGWSCVQVRHVECCACLWASWGWSVAEAPSSLWVGFLMESARHLGSMFLQYLPRVLFATYLTSSHPPNHRAPNSVSEWDEKEMSPFWQCPAQLGKQGAHSHALPFACRINQEPRKIFLGPNRAALGEGWCQINPNCSSYHLQCIHTCIFLLQCHARTSPLETWISTKPLFFICEWVSQVRVHQGLSDHDQEEPVHRPPQGHSWDWGLSAHSWAILLLGSLACGAGSHSSLKVLLSVGGYWILLLRGETKMEGCLMLVWCWWDPLFSS